MFENVFFFGTMVRYVVYLKKLINYTFLNNEFGGKGLGLELSMQLFLEHVSDMQITWFVHVSDKGDHILFVVHCYEI